MTEGNELVQLTLEDFDIPFRLYMSLRRYCKLHERMRSRIGQELGLTDAQYYILRALVVNGNVSYTQLATMTGLSQNNVSSLVKALINSGYIEQHPCETDGRITFLSLTEEGHQLMNTPYRCDVETAHLIQTIVNRIDEFDLIGQIEALQEFGEGALAKMLHVRPIPEQGTGK